MKKQFSDVLHYAFNSFIGNMHTALPGKFEKYDHTKKQAEVKPLIKKKFKNGEVLEMPIITNVPVIFPCTSDALITFPIKKGEGCLILFCERSLEKYLSSDLEDVEPDDPRKFSLTDGICIPGLFTFSNPGKTGNGNDLEILYKDAYIAIDDAGAITLSGSKITLDTGDALIWKPNVLATDPFSGVPHGGSSAAIVNLKGK